MDLIQSSCSQLNGSLWVALHIAINKMYFLQVMLLFLKFYCIALYMCMSFILLQAILRIFLESLSSSRICMLQTAWTDIVT